MVRSDRARNRCARLCLIMVAAGAAASVHAVEYTEGPAVAITVFKSSGPNAYVGKGLTDMVITDVVQMAPPPCKLVVVEWEKRALVEAEVKLQQRPEFDPATRVQPGKMIDARYFLEGSAVLTSTEFSWSLQLRDSKTNRIVARDVGKETEGSVMEVASQRIARRLLNSLCSTGADYSGRRTASPAPPPPPPAPASVQGPPPVPQAPPPPSPSQDVQDAVNTMNKLRGLFGR